MITIPENLEHPHRAAVFRSVDGGWSVLLGEIDDGVVRIEETRTFKSQANLPVEPENDDGSNGQSEIDGWLEEKKNPSVLVLLPASQTISRVLNLSETDTEEQVDQDLRLKAESHLLGGAPAHRVGMAALRAREGQPRQGILVSWPATSTVEAPSHGEGVCYVPDTAALLGMLPVKPCAQALIHADRSSGSMAIVLDSSEGLLVRSTRDPKSDPDNWMNAITRMVMETAIAGHETTENVKAFKSDLEEVLERQDTDQQEMLVIPDAAQRHLEQITDGAEGAQWWKTWGLSVGALLANAGDLQPLTRLQLRKKAESLSPVGEVAKHFSSLQVMSIMILAVLIAATFIPIFAAWMRLGVVVNKVDDIQSLKTSLTNFEQQKAVYRQLSGRSWPMTKLLGDLANCIPLGIEADTIMINEGDSVILRGRAGRFQGSSPIQLIAEAMDRMESTRVFGDINYTSDPEDTSGLIQFSITASVRNPYKNVRTFAQDFGKTPHVKLRYPHAFEDEAEEETNGAVLADSDGGTEGSSPQDDEAFAVEPSGGSRASAEGARSPSSSTRARSGTSRAPTRTGAGSSSSQGTGSGPGRRSEQTAARSSSEEAPIPDSLTDNEIAAMSRAELLQATSQVAKARQRSDLDEETTERLREDFNRLIQATKNVGRGGS